MANIMDYLDWRGDLSFSAAPFNEVDNVILCKLCSADLSGIVPPDDDPSRSTCLKRLFRPRIKDPRDWRFFSEGDARAAQEAPRREAFRDCLLFKLRKQGRHERDGQFSP